MDLAQALVTEAPVKWLIGRVAAVTGSTVTVTYRGGSVADVGVLDQYIPTVGDVVHILASDLNGMLAIGSNNQSGIPPVVPTAGPPVAVTATSVATYRTDLDAWSAGVLREGPTEVGCWFYPSVALAAAVASLPMAGLTIRVTAPDATPLEFVLHDMTSGAGALVLIPGASWRVAVPVGVTTDVRLPLEWASLLALGVASGVGIGGGDYTGTFTGSSGLLTFTPL
jgi:hypothetical protein